MQIATLARMTTTIAVALGVTLNASMAEAEAGHPVPGGMEKKDLETGIGTGT